MSSSRYPELARPEWASDDELHFGAHRASKRLVIVRLAAVLVIGVTGATGEVGGRLARRLAARGERQRLLARDVARVPALPGAEVVAYRRLRPLR